MAEETTKQIKQSPAENKNRLKSLFKTVFKRDDAQAPSDSRQELVQHTAITDNWQNRREGETYHNYGNRICAKATASQYTLSAFVQRIFNIEKQAQINNTLLQDKYKADIQGRISDIDGKINQANGKIDRLEVSRNNNKSIIGMYNDQLSELKAKNGQVNRNAKVKLYLGGIILLLLTLYLFVFYSSTFYSAFFKDFMKAGSTEIGAHMFDSQAIAASMAVGFGQLLFVLSAPIIFLGLGFSLHYFSKEKGYFKYIKITLVIIVTFIFDCILAYSIAKNIHDIQGMSSLEQIQEYSVSQAMTDSNVWAVIFCGFVVYIIWGIVFNLTMTAYEELKSNKNEQINLIGKIQELQEKDKEYQLQESEAKTDISELERKKNNLIQSLNNNNIIDNTPIKVAINDFYAGWMAMMAALSCSTSMQEDAQKVYKDNMETLFAINQE